MITKHTTDNMDQVVKKVIFNSEGIEVEPTNVGDNTLTYGYGYTFIRKGKDGWAVYGYLGSDLAAIGITLNEDEITKLKFITNALNQNNISLACTLIAQFEEDWRYANLTESEANTLYNLEINRKKEELATQFRKVLGTTNGSALLSGLQNSNEMITLLDMAYNGGAGLVGPKLISAMWEGNRAEAWFEIRYNSNNGRDLSMRPGLAKRRYLESQMFGFYDNPASVGLTEAQQIYKMLENHRSEIVAYEKNYGVPVDGTNPLQGNRIAAAISDFSGLLSYVQYGTIQTIEEALNPAKDALFTYLRGRSDLPDIENKLTDNNIASTNIYLNPHKDTDLDRTSVLDSFLYETGVYANGANDFMIGMDQSDYIFGNKGNDILIGEGGDDVLVGGEGNDVMYGGLGNDSYFIYAGDGNDTIEDKDGDNKIYLCDKEINFFYDAGSGQYKSPDGTLTGFIDTEGHFHVTNICAGTSVILNENFDWGDFGTTLISLPTNPATYNTIYGNSSGYPDDNHDGYPDDDIHDTPANDKIFALGGDDWVLCDVGGANWVLGGDGSDMAVGYLSSSSIIEGGSGSDIIFGGANGNNQLFGDSRGDGDLATIMAAHIADGETAVDSGTRGDLVVADGENSNFLFGSNGYDIMWGHSGRDVIVAGAGDDLIIGDGWSMLAEFDDLYTWSFNIQFDGSKYTPVITGLTYYDMDSSVDNDDLIYAGTGNDYVDAGGGADEVYGGAGNDTVLGVEGDDFIEGGDGDDTLIGDNGVYLPLEFNGNDYIDGGAGNDLVQGDGGDDALFGGAGNDTLAGGEGNDYLDGEAGLNTLYGGTGNDVLIGGDDGNLIIGEAGADDIYGGIGNDTLHGDASYTPLSDQGDDYIDGGEGNNLIYGYGGDDIIIGGDGNDSISADAGDDYVDAGDGTNIVLGGEGNNEIHTGTGDDQILVGNGSNYIDAGDGNNIVQCYGGDDVIYTGAGNDQILAGAGADTIYGGDGNDEIYADYWDEFYGDDFVDGGAGNDNILGEGGNDTLYGGDGNDTIQGDIYDFIGNDYLEGGAGADTLLGCAGNDILSGGPGNDYLDGGYGNDTYLFGRDDGADAISNFDPYGTDTVVFGEGITFADLDLEITNWNYLKIGIKGTTDSLLVCNQFESSGQYNVDEFHFADGTVITDEEFAANGYMVYGTSGNDFRLWGDSGPDMIFGYDGDDTLKGYDGDDTLDGGAGNDYLEGGGGEDTYLFGIGSGADTVNSYDYGNDAVQFGEGITAAGLNVSIGGYSDLVINIQGTTDSLTIESYFYPGHKIPWYKFADNTVIDANQLEAKLNSTIYGTDSDDTITGSAANDIIYGYAGNDTIQGYYGDDLIDGGEGDDDIYGDTDSYRGTGNDLLLGGPGNDCIDGGEGDDILSGGLGNDYLIGGRGNNTYMFGRGDGVDCMSNWNPYMTDTIVFGEGITFADLDLAIFYPYTLTIGIKGTTDSLTNYNQLDSYYDVDMFRFADGTVMTDEEFDANGYMVCDIEGNDWDIGDSGPDMIFGYDGDDYIDGRAGNDTLYGGTGNDTYYVGHN